MRTVFLLLLFLSFARSACAEDRELAGLFSRKGVEGTMVISSLRGGKSYACNVDRANRRYPVASTFKVFNTLISLQEKAVSGKDDLLKWDGRVYDFPDWNRDQTLESAFRGSCVWFYQELARRVGAEKYRAYVGRSAYGELVEPFDVTTFWLDGSLRISAVEQVDFLRNVCRRSLPFSSSSYKTLRQVMLAEKTPRWSLWAKTGWAAGTTPQIGWYVGYVETADDIWFFAMNIDIRNASDLPLRQSLTREALRLKGIID
ncbi:MAG: class D beta-lactamase [Chlorobiaceae bacterium]|nr:class D beta-lactamase [Chlorobiaceae bacterium]